MSSNRRSEIITPSKNTLRTPSKGLKKTGSDILRPSEGILRVQVSPPHRFGIHGIANL